jgi:hypothetical protein
MSTAASDGAGPIPIEARHGCIGSLLWSASTLAAGVAFYFVSTALVTVIPIDTSLLSAAWIFILTGVVAGLVAGVGAGVSQWWVVRRWGCGFVDWLVASILSWVAGGVVWWLIRLTLSEPSVAGVLSFAMLGMGQWLGLRRFKNWAPWIWLPPCGWALGWITAIWVSPALADGLPLGEEAALLVSLCCASALTGLALQWLLGRQHRSPLAHD